MALYIAQLGEPDMCTPIALSMSYPNRTLSGVKSLDFTQLAELTFLAPDMSRIPLPTIGNRRLLYWTECYYCY